MLPLVSVVIPIHNVGPYIACAIDSVLVQDYSRIEVIIVDDASTDDGGRIAKNYEQAHAAVKYLRSQRNLGLSATRNIGIEASKGEYLLFLDGDDYLQSGTISRCIREIQNRGVDIVLFGAVGFIDGASELQQSQIIARNPSVVNRLMAAERFLLFSLKARNYVPSACLYLFSRRLISNIRFLPGILHEDNLFTARVFLENPDSKVIAIPDELYNRRIRRNSITTMKKTAAHAEGFFRVAESLVLIKTTRGSAARSVLSWLIQFSLKEALYASQQLALLVPASHRMRAFRVMHKVPARYWSAKYAPVILVPDLLAFRVLVARWFRQ